MSIFDPKQKKYYLIKAYAQIDAIVFSQLESHNTIGTDHILLLLSAWKDHNQTILKLLSTN